MNKAYLATKRNKNLQNNMLYHLSNEMISYRTYNVQTFNDGIQINQRMNNRASNIEINFDQKNKQCFSLHVWYEETTIYCAHFAISNDIKKYIATYEVLVYWCHQRGAMK